MNILDPEMRKNYFNIIMLNFALFVRAMILLSPITLLFYQENGLTVKELFFFQGIFYLVSIIIELPVGYLADCFSKKKVLIISFMIFLLEMVLWYFYKGYWIILAGEVLYAMSKVSMDISTSGYLYDYLSSCNMQDKMPKFLGYLNFFLAGGTAAVGLVGAYLYQHFGSSNVIIIEIALITMGILMLLTLKDIPSAKKERLKISERYRDFIQGVKYVWKNNNIRSYIMYSGLLTSFSILFALSFQPLMQSAAFPVVLFGVVSFSNHGIRALFSALAGKFPSNIYKMRVPLYILYVLSFISIFILCFLKVIPLNLALILGICIIIGNQLMFTILHIARLHKYVDSACRGMAMSVNNIIPKILTVIILMSSRFFMKSDQLWKFYLIYFIFFLIIGFILLVKTKDIKE